MAVLPDTRQNNSINNSLDISSQPSLATSSRTDPCNDSAFFTTSAFSATVASFYAILIPLTVLGNGSAIAAFALNPRLRTATNILIIGLAASDLLVGTFAIPVWTFIASHENIMVGYCFTVYQVYISFDIFAGCASILQLTAIALERFLSIQWPLLHRKMPRCIYYIMLLVAWLFATAMAVLQPLQANTEIWRKTYTVVLFVSCFCCPFIIILTCYCCIFKTTRFQVRRRLSSGLNSRHCGSTPGVAIKELHVAITVAVITGVFLAAWFPFFVVTVTATFCLTCLPSGSGLLHLVKFLKFLQYSSSSVNPYIYAYRSREMRRTLTKIASKVFPWNLPGFGTKLTTHAKRDSKPSHKPAKSTDKVQAGCLESYHAMSKNDMSSEKDIFEDEINVKPTRKPQKKVKKKMVVILL